MAGMFYSLKEAAQKLGKTEDEVKRLAKEGKLREFRDGSNLLFKIDEIDALLAGGAEAGAADLELEELPVEEPVEALEDTAVPAVGESIEEDIFKLDEGAMPDLEAAEEGEEAPDLDLIPELEEAQAAETESQDQEVPEIDLEEPQGEEQIVSEDDIFLDEDLSPAGEEEEQPVMDEPEGTSEEISLAQESGILAEGSDISDLDTALTGEGINVLGETDTNFDVTEDSMAETAGPAASAGTSGEASLEEIEDDVNLDSFGSGSGLLDLSLQADDTSLGGILDEIYTSEGDATPGEPAEVGADVGEAASFDEITAEAEHSPADEEMAVPEPVAVMPTAMVPAYAEMPPDAQSNILGMLLFLPLAASLYTAIVAISGMKKFVPSILASVQSLIWYIMGAGVVLALVVFAVSFTVGREKAPKPARAVKDKKAKGKAEKPKKDKKAKVAKEKKGFSLFGKKKETA